MVRQQILFLKLKQPTMISKLEMETFHIPLCCSRDKVVRIALRMMKVSIH